MPKPIDEDRARRKELLEQKRAARRAAKEAQHALEEKLPAKSSTETAANTETAPTEPCWLLELPEPAVQDIFSLLPAADLGCLTSTCKSLHQLLTGARVPILMARLHRPLPNMPTMDRVDLVADEAEARQLLQQSLAGITGRILPRGRYAKQTSSEFVAYARFLEEAVAGYSCLSTGSSSSPIVLPRWTEGRFCSASPEHSLCRVGGDGRYSGAGGSGLASWGVGRRGQLGHGRRADERLPKRLEQFGYGVRIVQVAAGGGLVRVAHSLLLTSTGRVLSFGTGQYGALGHGYSAAKQLPDALRPRYIETLNGVRCTAVAAGELHSAVVSEDGDVYTFGDGFCGQLGHGDKRPQVSPKQVTMGGLEDEIVVSISCGSRHTLAITEDGEAYSWGLGHFGCLGRAFTPFEYDADSAVVALGPMEEAVEEEDADDSSEGEDVFDDDAGPPPPDPFGGLVDAIADTIVAESQANEDTTEQLSFIQADLDALRATEFSISMVHRPPDGSEEKADENADESDDDDDGTAPSPPDPFGGLVGAIADTLVAESQANEDTAEQLSSTQADLDRFRATDFSISVIHRPPEEVQRDLEEAPQEVQAVAAVARDFAAELNAHLDLIANLSLDDSSDQCIPRVIESLKGIRIVGASAGHRHSLFLDQSGALYSCGASIAGCLGHGDTISQMYPMRITAFDEENVCIRQMSAGVDMSMAVDTKGTVYAWGKTDGGRIGLGLQRHQVTQPRQVPVVGADGQPVKAVDVECGYVHSLIVGLDGTLHMCGGVGIDDEADGQAEDEQQSSSAGRSRPVADFNIWHRLPEPKEQVEKKERWKKYGKYEVKGRSKMLSGGGD